MTYDELIAILKDESIDLEESFTQTHIKLLVQRAQLRIERDIDLNAVRVEQTLPLPAGSNRLDLDNFVVTIRTVRIADGDFLMDKDVSFLRDFAASSAVTGTPRYYAWKDDISILVAPTPAEDTELELETTERIPVLSPEHSSNWLSENVPDLMQMSLLMEASHWSKDMEQFAAYSERYKETLQGVALEENLRKRMDEYRNGEPRIRTGR